MTLPTASALDRAWHCPASEHIDAPRVDTLNTAAASGTAAHEYLANCAVMSREDALDLVPDEWRVRCEAIEVDQLPACHPESYAAEVALAYDHHNETARVLGHDIDRAYNVGDNEFAGTADVIGLTDTAVVVLDYKGPWGHVPPAERNWQLRFLALAASLAYRKREAHVAIVRLREDGSAWFDRAQFDSIELDAISTDLRHLVNKLRAARGHAREDRQPRVTTGDHCRYCPVQRHCPAHTALLATIAGGDEPIVARGSEAVTWRRLKVARRLLDELDGVMRSRALHESIDLGDGIVVGPRIKEIQGIDGDVARAVIDTLWGEDAADTVVVTKATKSGITEAARKVKENHGGTLKGLVAEALESIERAGGIIVTRRQVVDEHRVPQIEEAPAS